MKLAVYIGKESGEAEKRISDLFYALSSAGYELYELKEGEAPSSDTDMLLSVGGDGTFLSSSKLVIDSGIPVVGVNLGRVGFLSENRPEDVADALLGSGYSVEDRAMLRAVLNDKGASESYALNEITVHRSGAAMLAVGVTIDGVELPAYWADGLIVSTSSGSTAYSLSAGGPIVLPASKVLIITPISPHNMNVRPLVVPDTAVISLNVHSRDSHVIFTADNSSLQINEGSEIEISLAQFSLKRVRLDKSDFINALTEKLYWGEDVRNIK
jgi:NAD+ kinase